MKYDKNLIKTQLKHLINNRKEMYKTSINTENYKKYSKYKCCKTQETLAEELKVERRTIGSWLSGKTIPSFENLISICEHLDCNIEYFLGAEELPYIDTVAKISHFTGINSEIINNALNNDDYLDCLNFFMNPTYFEKLHSEIVSSGWKKFWINNNLNKINNPLHDLIENKFNEFYLTHSLDDITSDNFKKVLYNCLPKSSIIITGKSNKKNFIYLKDCFDFSLYLDFKSKLPKSKSEQYDYFINFLCSFTFNSLLNNTYLELHKNKIADKFISILDNYYKEL